MDTVALAATIGGAAVGLAGVLGNSWTTWVQRNQASDLAEKQHEHERELARGERLYDRRAPVYEAMLNFVYIVVDRIEATEPIITFGDEPAPPEPPSEAETQAMQVRLRIYGSTAVGNGFDELAGLVRSFWGHAFSVRTIREQGGQMNGQLEELQSARQQVRDAVRELQRLVSEELAAL